MFVTQLCVALFLSVEVVGGARQPFTAAALVASDEYFDSTSISSALQNAVEDAGNSSAVQATLRITTGSAAQLAQAVTTASLIAVLAGVGPDLAVTTVEITSAYNLTVVSFATSCLVEGLTGSGHFCLLPSRSYLATGMAAFISQFGWQKAMIISESTSPYAMSLQQVALVVNSSTLTDTIHVVVGPGMVFTTHNFTDPDYHIFILTTGPTLAAEVICQAAIAEKGYPLNAWVLPGWFPERWWENHTTSCPATVLESFLHRAVAISHYPSPPTSHSEGCAIIPGLGRQFTHISQYSPYAYDAVWALTLTLNNSLSNTNTSSGLSFENISFSGVSGCVMFRDGARVLQSLRVLQYRKVGVLEAVEVASISAEGAVWQYIDGENESTLWPEGVPLDGTPVWVEHFIEVPVTVICYTYAVCGLCFALGCFVFNCVFHKRKLIKLSSPNLNYIIILGTVSMYLAVFFFAYPAGSHQTAIDVFCSLRIWLSCVGYDMSLGTVNVKMMRVYHIIRNPFATKLKPWKDWHLVLIILAFVLVDMVTLTVVTALPSERLLSAMFRDREHPRGSVTEEGVPVQFFILQCRSDSVIIWLSIIFGYKIVLQVAGVILAFLVRKVKIKGLNDTVEVRWILYSTSAVLLVVILTNFVFGTYINVFSSLFAAGIATGSTITLTLLFIPKMIALYHDPEGNKIFTGQQIVKIGKKASLKRVSGENDPSSQGHTHNTTVELQTEVQGEPSGAQTGDMVDNTKL